MKKYFVAGFIISAISVPAASLASSLTHREAVDYGMSYAHAAHVFGKRAVGCKLIGPNSTCSGKVTANRIRNSIDVLHRFFMPVPVMHSTPSYSSSSSGGYTNTTSYSSGGGCGGNTPYSGGGQCWAIPYNIVQCESGGTNIPNSQGSGANGYYQLMSGGTGSRSEQDAAAAKLWNGGAGASNWVCK